MLEWQKITRDGMLLLVLNNRNYIDRTTDILKQIHKEYISRNSSLYSSDEIYWINYFFDSVTYKLFLVRLAIEQLQTMKYGRIEESLWPAIENSLNTLNCSDDEQVYISFAFESFLFEVGSFIDIYMIFVCLLLKTGFSNQYMNQSTFF